VGVALDVAVLETVRVGEPVEERVPDAVGDGEGVGLREDVGVTVALGVGGTHAVVGAPPEITRTVA
jgi:hypothetical protein